MQGEFLEIANRIAKKATDTGITIKEIADIVSSSLGEVNCYPGIPTSNCYDVAFFISLSEAKAKGNRHLTFIRMINSFVRHFQKSCLTKTRHAVIITDNWWTQDYEKNLRYIESFKRNGIRIEAYFIDPSGKIIQINL